MTPKELLKKLKETGTGEAKLEVMRNFLRTKPKATVEELVKHLEKVGDPINKGTLAKVHDLMEGKEGDKVGERDIMQSPLDPLRPEAQPILSDPLPPVMGPSSALHPKPAAAIDNPPATPPPPSVPPPIVHPPAAEPFEKLKPGEQPKWPPLPDEEALAAQPKVEYVKERTDDMKTPGVKPRDPKPKK